MPKIVDTSGRPMSSGKATALSRPIAVPSLTGIRKLWDATSVASGLTPETLASTLKKVDEGDATAYLRLAQEMEQRDAHYRSVLGTRKRAVTRLPVTVEAATDEPADVALADEVRRVVRAPGFRGMLAHLLDGLGKGLAVVEMSWDTAAQPWVPRDRLDPKTAKPIRGFEWVDPRWFKYAKEDGRTLRLLDESAPEDGIDLEPYRFIVHEPELMSGHPLGRGLARVAAVAYMAKSYVLKDWLAFAEVYGMPLRVGRYGPSATEEDVAILVSAVANIGTDAAAAIPESMRIEFVEASKSSSAEVFSGLAEWADKQVSKAVLGQTASADGTPGALGNQTAQSEVRDDLRDADAEELADTLNRDLVGAYLALNRGSMAAEDAPRLLIKAEQPEDMAALTSALSALVPLGLRVEASVIRDKLGLPDPPDGEDVELLQPQTARASEPVAQAPAAQAPAANRRLALNAVADYPSEQTAKLGAACESHVRAMLDRVRTELNAATTMEQFEARILALNPEWDSATLADVLAEAFAASHLAGMDAEAGHE